MTVSNKERARKRDVRGDGPRGYHGHLAEIYPESAALRAVAGMDATWVSAVEVADRLGCHYETARRKCNALVEQGRLRSRKPKPRRKFYALPADANSESENQD